MNHDRLHKAARLRGLAMQLERRQLDADLAEAEVTVNDNLRAVAVERIRMLADVLESRGQGE